MKITSSANEPLLEVFGAAGEKAVYLTLVSVVAVMSAGLSAASPSEDYFRRAREAYATPAYAEGTNSVVTAWKITSEDHADRPSPGDTVRWIEVEGVRNFRDIGGWTGLRTGRAFRGTEADCFPASVVGTNFFHNLNVTEKGLATLREQLHVKTDLDLRKATECPRPGRSPLGVRLVRAPVRPYLELFDTTNAWAAALRTFADARNYPIYFHCWGGADRTGVLALLLEGLCGTSEADTTIDYELTTFGGNPRSRALDGRAKDMFYNLLRRIRAYPGGSFRDKIEALMKTTIGLTQEEVDAIRANLMDETPTAIAKHANRSWRVLSLDVSDRNPRNGEGDLIRLKDGRILFVYTEYNGTSADDHAQAHLVKRLSLDEGETWTDPVEVVPRLGRMNDMSVSFLRMNDGRLGLFYLRKNSTTDCRPIARYSSDEGETWGAPVETLPAESDAYHVMNNARVERLTSGRLLLPVARHSSTNTLGFGYGFLSCVYSDDDGRTWTKGREHLPLDAEGKPVLAQEPGVVELKDGRVYLYARTDRGCQWQAFSSDGGVTFTDFGPSPIYGPLGPATIRRLGDGRLLLAWNDHEGHPEYTKMTVGWCKGVRAPLTIAFSSDEGKTWADRRTIEPEVEKGFFCYFATLIEKDWMLLHYYNRPHLNSSCVTKIEF